MIISVVGQIASGKSTFCKWLSANTGWRHLDIAAYRIQAANTGVHAASVNKTAWANLQADILSGHTIIVESTGTCWQLGNIYKMAAKASMDTLVIKFITPTNICLQRIKERPRDKRFGNEEDNVAYEDEVLWKIPAHIIVDGTDLDEEDFKLIEWQIIQAWAVSQSRVLKNNQLQSEKSQEKEKNASNEC